MLQYIQYNRDMPKGGDIVLKEARKRKSIQEIFADYDDGYFETEEIDWGDPQGNEIW